MSDNEYSRDDTTNQGQDKEKHSVRYKEDKLGSPEEEGDKEKGSGSEDETQDEQEDTEDNEEGEFGEFEYLLDQYGFSREKFANLKEAFDLIDDDQEGTIDPRKLGSIMQSLGMTPTEAEVQDLINAVDEDGNGTVEFEEFVQLVARKVSIPQREDDVLEAFKVFDYDKDGAITVEDLSTVMSRLGLTDGSDKHEVEDMVRSVASGPSTSSKDMVKITKEDFLQLLRDDGELAERK